jgi:hypothetical protein
MPAAPVLPCPLPLPLPLPIALCPPYYGTDHRPMLVHHRLLLLLAAVLTGGGGDGAAATGAVTPPRVGVLINHKPMTAPCSGGVGDHHGGGGVHHPGSLDTALCNLQVFERAVAAAATDSVDLLVFPEAYALWVEPSRGGYWEPLWPSNNTACEAADPQTFPLQKRLSCIAAQYRVALAYNIFASRGGAKRITEVILSSDGHVVVTYDKVHLFPVVEAQNGATPGVNPPTSFQLLGWRWGILICYEGVYPFVPGGSWKQMDGLMAQNATHWIWSIGSMVAVVSA